MAGALIASPAAQAGPQGGQVVAGSATITQTASNRLDVLQSSHRAIVDWRGFSIGAGEHTHFQQPSSASVALNRVKGGEPSRILGQLSANGQVMLVNPNGVFFGPGSRVDVGALMASTADIANDDFLAGRYRFTTPSPNPDAGIFNQGEIRAADGGFVVLAAPYVRNEGSIQARLGQVVLAGAPTFTVDFDGDGLLQFDLGGPVQAAPRGEDGQPVGALVTHAGTVQADGGRVTLTARAADQVIDRVIHMGGVVQAQTVESRGGEIILGGGNVGTVAVTGTLDASGPAADQRGGTVKVLGEKVGLFDGARGDASGGAGGGKVLIGGNFRGLGPEPNARRTYVSRQASLQADALVYGGGGTLIVWSDEATAYHGRASARGGPQGGSGGSVEVSGKRSLVFDGQVDLGAPRGLVGTLLLDPATLTIVDEPPTALGGPPGTQDANVLADGQILAGDSDIGDNTVSWLAIRQLDGNVVLEATGDVTVGDITGVTFAQGNIAAIDVDRLTIRSVTGSITFADLADSIHTTGGDLVMSAGGNITAGTLVTVGPPVTGSNSGSITLTAGGGISAVYLNTSSSWGNAGNVTLTATAGDIAIGSIGASSSAGNGGNLVLDAGGNVTGTSYFDSMSSVGDGGSISIDAGGTVSLYGLRSDASGSGGNLSVSAGGNVVTGGLTATGGPLGGNITVRSTGGNVDTSTIVLNDGVFFGGTVSATASDGTGGELTFTAAGSITPADNVRTTSNDVTFDGAVALTANNPFASPTVSVVIDGDGGDITFTNTVNQARNLVLSAGAGSIRVAGPAGTTEALTSLTTDSVAALNGAVTTGAQSYNAGLTASGDYRTGGGAFTVTGPATIAGPTSIATAGGAIGFGGPLDADPDAGAVSLVLAAASGSVTLSGDLGAITPLTSLEVTSAGTFSASGIRVLQDVSLTAEGMALGGTVQGSGVFTAQPVSPTHGIVLGGLGLPPDGAPPTLYLSATELARISPSFSSLVFGRADGQHPVTVTGATFGSPATVRTPLGGSILVTSSGGAGILGAGSVTLLGAGATTTLAADILTTGEAVVIDDVVRVAADVVIDTTRSLTVPGGGEIRLLRSVDSAQGQWALSLNAGAAAIEIGGSTGGLAPLASLDATAATIRLGEVATAGPQRYTGAVTLGGAYGTGGGTFTVTGPLTFAAASTVATGGGALEVSGATTLGGDLRVTTQGGGIDFGGAITGPFALALATEGPLGITAPITAGLVTLSTGGALTQAAPITATGLALLGAGPVTLTDPGNAVGTLAADLGGALAYRDSAALVLGTVGTTTGVRFGDSLSLTAGGGLSQTGALQQIGTGAVTLAAGTGPLVLDLATNELQGPVRVSTSSGTGRLTDATLLSLATSSFGATDFTITAGDLDIVDPDSLGTVLSGTGNLRLQPLGVGASIGLGNGEGDFRLSQAELDRISPTFASLTIGREDGQHAISIWDVTFGQSLTIQTPAGGRMVIDASEGTVGIFGNGSVTLIGSGATTFLNAGIRTTGQPIVIRDRVVLGRGVTLSTFANEGGAGISLLGPVDGAFPLTLVAGGGDIVFGGPVGASERPTQIAIESARDVRIGALLAAGDVSVTHSRDFTSVENALDVGSLFISPEAFSANVFGRVAGLTGEQAAQAVEGPDGNPNFRVNGYVVARAPITPGPPASPPEIPTILPSVFPFGDSLLAEPQATGGQPLRLPTPFLWVVARPQFLAGDPTQAQFSNFGNEELWGVIPRPEAEVR